jgi:hypothetical protein
MATQTFLDGHDKSAQADVAILLSQHKGTFMEMHG